MAMQPDILIFLSDQHDGRVQAHMGDGTVRTPHLDRLAREGVTFTQAYTPCPLCVPARMSLLTGQLPSHTGVFINNGSIHPEMPTFLHALELAGYETVLCGRMHFEGEDQRHGFSRRIALDVTPTDFGGQDAFLRNLAPCGVLLTGAGCLQAVGGGNSPALEYDRYVVSQAVSWLGRDHERPQCLVVGTYGPHHPYVAPPELYQYYHDRVSLPGNLEADIPSYCREKPRDSREDLVRAVRAAYYGMIEFEDSCVGTVRAAWTDYLTRTGRKGVFAYLSDHGDHAGERGLYGKQTLFEPSLRIPALFAGEGIPANRRLRTPVGLLDIAPTIIDLAGGPPLPDCDGHSLLTALQTGEEPEAHTVISEWITSPYNYGIHYGRMARKGRYKLVHFPDFPGEDLLTAPEEDFWETENLLSQMPEAAAALREESFSAVDPRRIVDEKNRRARGLAVLNRLGACRGAVNRETWRGTPDSRLLPERYVHTNVPLPLRFRPYWLPEGQPGAQEE